MDLRRRYGCPSDDDEDNFGTDQADYESDSCDAEGEDASEDIDYDDNVDGDKVHDRVAESEISALDDTRRGVGERPHFSSGPRIEWLLRQGSG